MRSSDLARAAGIPIPTAQRIVAGNSTRPHMGSLIPIAAYFQITLEQLKGLEPIEWLNDTTQLKELGVHQVPLLDWRDVKEETIKPTINIDEKIKKIFTETPVSSHAFALKLKDSSMEPIFPINSLVIFDPQKSYRDRHYILVKLHSYEEPLFRQLIIDAGDLFVKPLHPDLEHFRIHKLLKNDNILATLIEAKQQFTT